MAKSVDDLQHPRRKQYPIVAASMHHPSTRATTQYTTPMPDSTTPAFTVRQLSTLTDEDLENASETLSLAFHNDQFTRVITGKDDDFYEEFLTSTLTASQLCGGEIYVAETREKQVVGVAMWFGPGRALHLGSSPEDSGQEAGIFASDMKPDLRQWWESEFIPKHKRLSDAGLGPGTKLANWNLQIIATHPNYVRKGVCRTMIEIVERKASANGHLMCMEVQTEVNVGIFRRLGFEVAAEPLLFEGLDGVFPMWIMKKETKSITGRVP